MGYDEKPFAHIAMFDFKGTDQLKMISTDFRHFYRICPLDILKKCLDLC